MVQRLMKWGISCLSLIIFYWLFRSVGILFSIGLAMILFTG